MSSLKESSGPVTCGVPTNSLTADSASTQIVDVLDVTTPDKAISVCPQPGSTAGESGLFEERFDSLKSARGDGSLAAVSSEWRSTANAATNSQAEKGRTEGGLQPGSFESITESHRSVVVPSPPDQKSAELSPKRRRKRGGSPLVVSPDLRGTLGKEMDAIFFVPSSHGNVYCFCMFKMLFRLDRHSSSVRCSPTSGQTVRSVVQDWRRCASFVTCPSLALALLSPFTTLKLSSSPQSLGTFSSVFLARLKCDRGEGTRFALKHIVPTSAPCRIENELRCLQVMG